MYSATLSTADLVMVGVYLAVIFGLGALAARQEETAEGYFLAGRSLAWPLVGFSLFASNISSSTLVGLAGSAYGTGIAVYNYEWMAVLVLVFFVLFILPLYLRSGIYTTPEFLERRYDARARYYFSGLSIFGNIVIDIAGALYAGGLVIQAIYPAVPLWVTITVIAVAAGLYTIVGGLRAVVYTDTVQAILLTLGAAFVAFEAYRYVGSWEAVTSTVPPEMMRLIQPADSEVVPWPGLLTGLVLLGIYYWCTNQAIVQRVLGARDVNHGRWGALFAGLLKLPVLFVMVLPGLFARLIYPDLENPDLVFPTLIVDLLPGGVRGLILMAFLAAIMSSVDSVLNSASTLITFDFVEKWRPGLTSRRLVWVGRLTTGIIITLGAVVAPQIARFASLWDYLQSSLAFITPPIVALYLLGIFWKRANASGAVAALGGGVLAAVLVLALPLDLHFLYVAAGIFGVAMVLLVVVSLLTAPPDPCSLRGMVWSREAFADEAEELSATPWYANYRLLSLVLLLLTLGVVALFG